MTDDIRDIEFMFQERDRKRYYENLERARANSVNTTRVQKQVKRKTVKKNLLMRILPIGVSAIILFGMVNYAKNNNPYTDPHNMINMSPVIGSMVNDGEKLGIVSQNTYRLNGNAAYSHDGIARDLINLEDSRLFDYALCCVYNDMGNNVNTQVTSSVGSTKSNIDFVISDLKLLSSGNSSEMEKYISSRLENINSMDEYLITYGYVDKDNNPSYEVFKNAMNEEAADILSLIDSSKGVHKNGM